MKKPVLRTSRVSVILVSFAVMLIAGCGGGSESGSSSTGSTDAAEIKKGGTLRVAQEGDVNTLDPLKAIYLSDINIVNQVVEGLFRNNNEEETVPWLASSYENSPDFREWTFHLRPNVKFSTGQAMTSADVVFSLENARKSVIASSYEPISEVKAPDPSTVVVKTKVPAPTLPVSLSLWAAGIVPKDFGGVSEQAFAQNPIGTGPFEITSWKRGQALTMEGNPHYWKAGLPYLDKVEFVAVADDNSRVSQLKAGSLDAIAKPSWAQIASLENSPGLEVLQKENALVGSLILNVRDGYFFSSPEAREALNLSLNREDITAAGMRGLGQVAVSLIPAALEYSNQNLPVPTQDLEKAKALLAEAERGGGSQNLKLAYNGEEEYNRNSAQVIQQNMEEAGFQVTLQPLDGASFEEELLNGEFDFLLSSTSSAVKEPSEMIGYYNSSEGLFTGADVTEIAKLSAEAAQASETSERRDLYYEIQKIMVEENSLVNINNEPFVWALQDDVKGLTLTVNGNTYLAVVGFSE